MQQHGADFKALSNPNTHAWDVHGKRHAARKTMAIQEELRNLEIEKKRLEYEASELNRREDIPNHLCQGRFSAAELLRPGSRKYEEVIPSLLGGA